MLHKGQRVVCISTVDLGTLGYGDEDLQIVEGAHYTVRDVVVDHFGTEGVLLNEVRNDRLPYRIGDKTVDFEKSFAAWRFRPLVEGLREKEMEAA